MSTRKRTRQAPEKERKSNVPLKTSKTEKLAVTNTDAIEESKTDLTNNTMNLNDSDLVAGSFNLSDDGIGIQDNSGSSGDTSDGIISAADDLLREADVLIAEIAELRRENNSEDNPINDDDPVVASESTESIHQSSGSSSSVEVTATTAASNTLNASTSANTGHNIIDDSVVLIDDSILDTPIAQPIVRDDDEDVIFVTENRPQLRTIATIDLCNTPDNSFSCTSDKQRGGGSRSTSSIVSPDKSNRSQIGLTKCPICLELFPMSEILSTMCGHLYCEPCIRSVIKVRKKCPMCNRGLRANQVHRIFIDS